MKTACLVGKYRVSKPPGITVVHLCLSWGRHCWTRTLIAKKYAAVWNKCQDFSVTNISLQGILQQAHSEKKSEHSD